MAATLKEIADVTGMSIRSVSRALRGLGGISEENARIVREKAAQLGYVPNIAARNLRLKRNSVVGVVSGVNSGEVFGKKNMAIQQALEQQGLFPLLGLCHDDEPTMHKMFSEWTGILQKVICLAWPDKLDYRIFEDAFKFQFIFIDCAGRFQKGCSRIDVDRAGGVSEAVKCFYANSRRNIVHCGHVLTRKKGFEQAFDGIEADPVAIATNGIEFVDGYKAGTEIINTGADAVFFDTDRMALGFYRYAHENGIRIPEDVAVAGFDDDRAGSFASPSLSSVAHPVEEIAQAAVAQVLSDVPGNNLFSTRFIRRESI